VSEQRACVEDEHSPGVLAHLVHHVAGATGTGATFAVPQADKLDLVCAQRERRAQLPQIVALVRIHINRRRAERVRLHVDACQRVGLEGVETIDPGLAGKRHRRAQKVGFAELQVKLHATAARHCCLGKQGVAATRAAADREVVRAKAERIEPGAECVGSDGFLVGGKARCGAIGRVDHVAAEQKHTARQPRHVVMTPEEFEQDALVALNRGVGRGELQRRLDLFERERVFTDASTRTRLEVRVGP